MKLPVFNQTGSSFYEGLIVIATAIIVRVITVMTGKAGGSAKVLRVTIAACSPAVVDAESAFVGNARVRTVIGREPIIGRVAARAVCAEHPGMERRVAVTGHAGGGKPRELTGSMTALALQSNMPPSQREVRFVVVEGRILPTGRAVAGGTVCAEPSVVFIVLLMTGVTIAGGVFVDAVLVAFFTSHFGMFTFQFEGGEVVVESGGHPTFGGMAGGTVEAKTSLVRVVLAVAGGAILRGIGEIGEGARIQVTLGA